MFGATFLGHQGWLFRSERTVVLVDPLLTDGFGHGGHCGRVYPPRRVDPAAFPAVDAVILSHEHDDHFDVPSLHRLDRRIPIHLSARSSGAAFELLRHMGFGVHALPPEQERAVGDLRVRSFVADHRTAGDRDEWDVHPLAIWDAAGHGSFVSTIDVAMPDDLPARLRALAIPPGIWGHANNTGRSAYQHLPPPPVGEDDTEALARVVLRRHARLREQWGAPVLTWVCGAGWSFPDDRAWIDHHAFPIDPERLCERLRAQGEGRFEAAVPGDAVVLRDGGVAERRVERGFIEVAPRERWPSRRHDGQPAPPREYAPACGRRRLASDAELDELLTRLDDYARHLYGGAVFRSLCSLPPSVDAWRSAWALWLRDDERDLVLRHDPSRCGFVREAIADPPTVLLSGMELWATDLLAFLRGELGASAICYAGRLRVWNHRPSQLRVTPHDLWMYGHPLRRPEATAALYRRLLEQQPEPTSRVPVRG